MQGSREGVQRITAFAVSAHFFTTLIQAMLSCLFVDTLGHTASFNTFTRDTPHTTPAVQTNKDNKLCQYLIVMMSQVLSHMLTLSLPLSPSCLVSEWTECWLCNMIICITCVTTNDQLKYLTIWNNFQLLTYICCSYKHLCVVCLIQWVTCKILHSW